MSTSPTASQVLKDEVHWPVWNVQQFFLDAKRHFVRETDFKMFNDLCQGNVYLQLSYATACDKRKGKKGALMCVPETAAISVCHC